MPMKVSNPELDEKVKKWIEEHPEEWEAAGIDRRSRCPKCRILTSECYTRIDGKPDYITERCDNCGHIHELGPLSDMHFIY